MEIERESWVFFLQATLATKDRSCESVVTSGQHHVTPQHPPRDASPAGLVGLWLLGPFLSSCFVTTLLCVFVGYKLMLVFFPVFCLLQKRL